MSGKITFDRVNIGKKFLAPSGITFKKISVVYCIPVIDANKKAIANGEKTASFYSTKIVLETD